MTVDPKDAKNYPTSHFFITLLFENTIMRRLTHAVMVILTIKTNGFSTQKLFYNSLKLFDSKNEKGQHIHSIFFGPSFASYRRLSTKLNVTGMDYLVDSCKNFISTTNQNIQAQIFSDLSHVCLDFLTLFSPNTLALRLLVLCGRTCSIAADLSYDNTMTADEAIFQSIMMIIALKNLTQKLIPLTYLKSRSSFRDRRIYHTMFRKAGFGYIDFLILISDVFQWVEVPNGTIFAEDADNLLITYNGIVVEGDIIYGQRNGASSYELIGNITRAAHLIDGTLHENSGDFVHNRNLASPLTYLEARSTRTLLLRINMKRLKTIIEKDNKMRECIKNLLLIALQDKLSRYSTHAGS